MVQAMYSAVSGVAAHQTRLDVIGNNIANVNTVAYKAGRATFYDQLSQTIQGASRPTGGLGGTNPMQVGLGVRIGSITTQQTQGALQQTGRPSDLAIQGNGFFMVGNGDATFYSRDGGFTLDADGNLVSATTGMKLLGWQASADGSVDTSGPVTPASSIRVPIATLTSVRQTSTVDFAGNLDARVAPGSGAIYERTGQVFDSLGNPHEIAFRFERIAPQGADGATWQFTTSIDGGAPSTAGGPNSGTISFDSAGKVTGWTGTVDLAPGGAAPFTITPSFKDISQLSGEYTANAVGQDGFPFGTLQSYSIGEDGLVTGIFSNGLNRSLGSIAISQFANPAGLDKLGTNLYRPTPNSGAAQVTPPGVAGAGRVSGGFLEQSNVNLAEEFSSMILTQRGFQANTRIVTASDEILQDLIQMKR